MGSIWQTDNDYERLQDLTDEIVEKAEEKLKVKLPKTYINILKEQNGGYINYNSHPCSEPNSWAEDHVHIDHFFGIGDLAGNEGILQSPYLIKEWDLPENIVLISGDGHTWIALDYRNKKEDPPVIYVDPDVAGIIPLAPNFETFLKGLTYWQ
ncbi:hypothetical protein J2S74_000009 [Evansella vedderi]|uniref:Knr4/Smi1-like domain-containing protein n=2 Tax=Evansella vedderi TaxID=38282 RepID=A0ABT9ZN62_9BACI|nr:hypothetical protein [Evansella vedderi]